MQPMEWPSVVRLLPDGKRLPKASALCGVDIAEPQGRITHHADARVEYGSACFDASVVDQNIQLTESPYGLIDKLTQVRKLAHIGIDTDSLTTELAGLPLELLSCLRMDHIVDDDAGLLTRSSSSIAWPMPLLPPVTMATLFFKDMTDLSWAIALHYEV
jgi:hypothetical protein